MLVLLLQSCLDNKPTTLFLQHLAVRVDAYFHIRQCMGNNVVYVVALLTSTVFQPNFTSLFESMLLVICFCFCMQMPVYRLLVGRTDRGEPGNMRFVMPHKRVRGVRMHHSNLLLPRRSTIPTITKQALIQHCCDFYVMSRTI